MSDSLTQLISSLVDSDDFALPVFSPVAMEIQKAVQSNSEFKIQNSKLLKR